MRDTYSDTWSGNFFVGFGLNETITRSDNGGASKSVNFTTEGCPVVVPEPEEETEDSTDTDEQDDDNVELDKDDDDDDEPSEDTWIESNSSFYMAAYYNNATDYYFPGAKVEGGFNMKKGALHMSATLAVSAMTLLSLQ